MKVKAWKPSYTAASDDLPDVLGIDDAVRLVAPSVALDEPYPLNAAVLLCIRMFEKRIPFTIEHEFQGTLLAYDGDKARGDDRILAAVAHSVQVVERLVKDAIETRIKVAELQQEMLAQQAQAVAVEEAEETLPPPVAEPPSAPPRARVAPPPPPPAAPPPPPVARSAPAEAPRQPQPRKQPPKGGQGLKDLGLLK